MEKYDLSKKVIDQLQKDFSIEDHDEVINCLVKYDDVSIERVQLAILALAEGDKNNVCQIVNRAIEDYRDILVEYSFCIKNR